MESWEIVVAGPARADLRDILRWTRERFGPAQAEAYAGRIEAAIRRLRTGPAPAGSRAAHPLRADLRKLPVGRKASHLLIYREAPGRRIEILRVLHDAMDVSRHLPPASP